MKQYNINIVNNLTNETTNATVRSLGAMWNYMRAFRATLTAEAVQAGVHAVVTEADGTIFQDITFRVNKKGKFEMPNANIATRRSQMDKAKKAAKAAAEKAEAKKAKKREADRRYREKKKAAKLAEIAKAAETPAAA